MILIDTNVLVALADERDGLRTQAMADLGRLKGPYEILDAVLVETFFLLEESYLRQRVRFVLERIGASHAHVHPDSWATIFSWLEKYDRHKPDVCDAMLIAAATRQKCAIWTYDKEFSKLWRSIEGKPIQLVGTAEKARRRKVSRT